jgi:hypothetical protein
MAMMAQHCQHSTAMMAQHHAMMACSGWALNLSGISDSLVSLGGDSSWHAQLITHDVTLVTFRLTPGSWTLPPTKPSSPPTPPHPQNPANKGTGPNVPSAGPDPAYSDAQQQEFEGRAWIGLEDRGLLDVAGTELLLVGAKDTPIETGEAGAPAHISALCTLSHCLTGS